MAKSRAATAAGLLERVVPFRFLPPGLLRDLAGRMQTQAYRKGELILAQDGEDDDRSLYILARGLVESRDVSYQPPRRISLISVEHYFGEYAALFRQKRDLEFRAVEPSLCYSLRGDDFLGLLRQSRVFAQAIGTMLRDKHGLFAGFEQFTFELARGAGDGYLNIQRLRDLYRELDPALHEGARAFADLDLAALSYAVRRLPDNITRTFALLLTDEIPEMFSNPEKLFQRIPSGLRNRYIYEMYPGKTMIVLRSGVSDLTDLVTCLLLYSVETKKIANRLKDPELNLAVENHLSSGPMTKEQTQGLLGTLPFSAPEREGLQRIWPDDTVNRIQQLVVQNGNFSVEVKRQVHLYSSRSSEVWTSQIFEATKELLGCTPASLPEGVRVHIISSNTYSVLHCLNPFIAEHSERILLLADKSERDSKPIWANPFDRVYAYASDYLNENSDEFINDQMERGWGLIRLHRTVSTGIQVQLLDLSTLRGRLIDPGLAPIPSDTRDLIVNIDFAFGEQAQEIMRNLLMLFGSRLASINILGKAGALVGRRGGVLVPTAFIEQSSDTFAPLANDGGFEGAACAARLAAGAGSGGVHRGPLLTVGGTLLQNKQMLHFYREIWGCVGIEMEGYHYRKQVTESSQLGVVPGPFVQRYLYYISDLPLEKGERLSRPQTTNEVIPPLYAVTREILNGILKS